jgi:hypothetical protein
MQRPSVLLLLLLLLLMLLVGTVKKIIYLA